MARLVCPNNSIVAFKYSAWPLKFFADLFVFFCFVFHKLGSLFFLFKNSRCQLLVSLLFLPNYLTGNVINEIDNH